MKKVVLSLMLALGLAACGDKTEAPKESEKPVIKIGVLLPLTGNSAFAGVSVQKAINLAFEDIKNSKKLKYNYELIFDDTQNIQKQSLLNASRLTDINKVNALISMWSPAGLVVSPLAEKKKIIHMGCSWGYDVAKGQYNFNHATFPEEQTEALVKELVKKDIKSIGLIWDADKSQQELISILEDKLKIHNIHIAFNEMINRGQVDFRTEILKMKQTKAEMIFMLLMPPGMNTFMKQKEELSYNIPVTSIEYFSFQPNLFEGMWFVSDALGTPKFEKYIKTKTGENLNSCMGNLYDTLGLLINAYETSFVKNGHKIPENIDVSHTLLNTKNYQSVMGNIKIDKDGNITTLPSIKKIINGKPVIIEE